MQDLSKTFRKVLILLLSLIACRLIWESIVAKYLDFVLSRKVIICEGLQDKRAWVKIAADIIAEDIRACGQNSIWSK